MAVGFGSYRFVPIPSDDPGGGDRYEFFGQGLVELSRLTSGKASREIDEVRMHLLNLGYPEATVAKVPKTAPPRPFQPVSSCSR
jgi:hypothetical protein